MAYFSDRFVSLNKIIIAAIVVYAGATAFAHADPISPQKLEFFRCVTEAQQEGPVKYIDTFGTPVGVMDLD